MARKKKISEEGGEGWIVTFADLMTLLLCFFVLLYAMAPTIDEERFQALSQSLQNAFLGNIGQNVLDELNPEEETGSEELEGEDDFFVDEEGGEDSVEGDSFLDGLTEELYQAVEEFLGEQGLSSEVNVEIVPEGVLLDVKERVFFDMGKAEIKPQSVQTLSKLGEMFKQFENEVRVIGHTDNVPISTSKYPSNWELAAARSCAIVRFYNQEGFEPQRFVCMSYGETMPIDSNDTEDGRTANRRVNFLIEAEPSEIRKLADALKKTE